MPWMSENGVAQLRSLKREGSVRASVPPNPPTSRSDCVLTQSQETLWPLRAALLWGNIHACWAGGQRPTSPHDAPATYQPKITKTHTHTLLFNYWYCIDLDSFAGTKKLNSSLDLWTLNVWLPELGAAFRNHDVTVMLVNPPPERPFLASHTRWRADVTSVF